MTSHDMHLMWALVVWMIFGIYCGIRMWLKIGPFLVKDLWFVLIFAIVGPIFLVCLIYDFFNVSEWSKRVLFRSDQERRFLRHVRKIEEAQQANEQARIERELGVTRQGAGYQPINRNPPPKRP